MSYPLSKYTKSLENLMLEWERIAVQNQNLAARLGKYNLGFAEGLRFCINDMRRELVAQQQPNEDNLI